MAGRSGEPVRRVLTTTMEAAAGHGGGAIASSNHQTTKKAIARTRRSTSRSFSPPVRPVKAMDRRWRVLCAVGGNAISAPPLRWEFPLFGSGCPLLATAVIARHIPTTATSQLNSSHSCGSYSASRATHCERLIIISYCAPLVS